jgi:hypothetical protein
LADAQTRRAGIPPGEYFLEGRLYRPGHFLFFSSYDQSGQHDIVVRSHLGHKIKYFGILFIFLIINFKSKIVGN